MARDAAGGRVDRDPLAPQRELHDPGVGELALELRCRRGGLHVVHCGSSRSAGMPGSAPGAAWGAVCLSPDRWFAPTVTRWREAQMRGPHSGRRDRVEPLAGPAHPCRRADAARGRERGHETARHSIGRRGSPPRDVCDRDGRQDDEDRGRGHRDHHGDDPRHGDLGRERAVRARPDPAAGWRLEQQLPHRPPGRHRQLRPRHRHGPRRDVGQRTPRRDGVAGGGWDCRCHASIVDFVATGKGVCQGTGTFHTWQWRATMHMVWLSRSRSSQGTSSSPATDRRRASIIGRARSCHPSRRRRALSGAPFVVDTRMSTSSTVTAGRPSGPCPERRPRGGASRSGVATSGRSATAAS